MTTRTKTSSKPAAAPAPAARPAATQQDQTPAPAVTKYTRKMAEDAKVEGVSKGNALTFAKLTLDGKPVFKQSEGTFKAGAQPKMRETSYKAAMYGALKGQPFAEGVAASVVACATQSGAVPPRYADSYRLTATWLADKGAHPGKTHLVNTARHIAGYINGWMLKSGKGGMTLS